MPTLSPIGRDCRMVPMRWNHYCNESVEGGLRFRWSRLAAPRVSAVARPSAATGVIVGIPSLTAIKRQPWLASRLARLQSDANDAEPIPREGRTSQVANLRGAGLSGRLKSDVDDSMGIQDRMGPIRPLWE